MGPIKFGAVIQVGLTAFCYRNSHTFYWCRSRMAWHTFNAML